MTILAEASTTIRAEGRMEELQDLLVHLSLDLLSSYHDLGNMLSAGLALVFSTVTLLTGGRKELKIRWVAGSTIPSWLCSPWLISKLSPSSSRDPGTSR